LLQGLHLLGSGRGKDFTCPRFSDLGDLHIPHGEDFSMGILWGLYGKRIIQDLGTAWDGVQWIGLRENLQETGWVFQANSLGFLCKCAHQPILGWVISVSLP
jgi:hypothetical protein